MKATQPIHFVGEMGFGWLRVDVVVYIEGYYLCFFDMLRK